jgi:predicted RNase H-like HicB family nuclease
MILQRILHAVIYPDDESGFVAERPHVSAVTEGATLDETVANLREAVALALDGEDLADLGLAPSPVIAVTFEVEPAVA